MSKNRANSRSICAAAHLLWASLVSCGPLLDPGGGKAVDLHPPVVETVRTISGQEIAVDFDEEAALAPEKIRITPTLPVRDVSGPGKHVVIRASEQTPGSRYTLEAEASDSRGNSLDFLADFYGFNASVPRILINELSPRGSGNHPDLIELALLSDGDMGGVGLYVGTSASFDARLVFPSFRVKKGDFIVVHCRPLGDPGEVDETADRTQARGLDCTDEAFDFWLPEGKGIGGNNGALSLFQGPGGALIDAAIYSNRTSQSDELYRGFGSSDMRERAEDLARQKGWRAAGQRVTPEDCINPEGSTGTRSICRSSSSEDTDSRADWHIVPTRGASFGKVNTDEAYVAVP